ncbi:type 2C Protein Phosphatase [Trichosporon asahii var. asahii CBS 8904]|uniref:Type 2C Protein Phosphatase n=1 Tax=Trichosporon asahii var. asahii (strain CBS 8904) TaxID=1220162 RepID=K1VXP6_TRIAC|nr:type 2C Protein Phosphatase [Trichosporon asahii var. asahii CBS 8904]
MLTRLRPMRSTLARVPLRAGAAGLGMSKPTTATTARIVQRRFASNSGYNGPSNQSEVTPDTKKRNAIIATILLAAAGGVWYWETKTLFEPAEPDLQVSYGSGSRRQTVSFKRKSVAEANAMLKEHEETRDIERPGNPVARLDTNYIASNEPIEDRSAADVIPRGQPKGSWWGSAAPADAANKPGKRDLVFVSVIDGHAGDATSQLLSKTLHPTLTIALAGLQSGIIRGHSFWHKAYDWMTFSKAWTPPHVADALKHAFVTLDDNICYGASRMLPNLNRDDPAQMAKFLVLAEPAASGAVVGTAVVDSENDDLYVAVTGDCRAVAGWQAPDGSWRADTLSEDQMGDNPKEVAR